MKKTLSMILVLLLMLTGCSSDTVEQYNDIMESVSDGSPFIFEMNSEDGYTKYVYNKDQRLLAITEFMDEGFSTYVIDSIAYTCNENEEICIAVSEDYTTSQDIYKVISPYLVNLDDYDYDVVDNQIIGQNFTYTVFSDQIEFDISITNKTYTGTIKLENTNLELPYEITTEF